MTDQSLPIGKIVLWGAGVAVGSILVFGGIWFGLGWVGVADLPRLVLAVCTPPGVMTVVLLWVYLRRSAG
jgi:hypothetical protein